jgi:hypothetical protein
MSNTNTSTVVQSELQAELERLRAENAALIAAKTSTVSIRVSDKGAVSVYGLGRFPVTLYKEQMEKLLGLSDDICRFMVENEAKLSVKAKPAPKT